MLLHQLLLSQRHSPDFPLVQPAAHQVKGPLRLAEPPLAVKDPARSKSLLRDDEALASGPKGAGLWDTHVVVVDLTVSSEDAQNRGVADELVARVVGGDNDHAEGQVKRGVSVKLSPGHHHGVG